MFAGAAEANTSAGAPLVICSARPELGPKLNFTVSPGWAASNCLPSWVKVPVSDAAAKTVIVPPDGLALEPTSFPSRCWNSPRRRRPPARRQ